MTRAQCPSSSLSEAGLAKLLDDRREKSRSDSQIEKFVAVGVVLLVSFGRSVLSGAGRLWSSENRLDVIDAVDEPFPKVLIDGLPARIFGNFFGKHLAERFGGRSRWRQSRRWRTVWTAGRRWQDCTSAGISLRLVRSPVAPKITMTQGRPTGLRICVIGTHETAVLSSECVRRDAEFCESLSVRTFFSTCPPNWKRMAESILSAKSSSPREVKR